MQFTLRVPKSLGNATRLGLALVVAGGVYRSSAQDLEQFLQEAASSTTTGPYAGFQYATITGSGNTVTATWVPVVNAGKVVYKNLTLQFALDTNGNFTTATIPESSLGAGAFCVVV